VKAQRPKGPQSCYAASIVRGPRPLQLEYGKERRPPALADEPPALVDDPPALAADKPPALVDDPPGSAIAAAGEAVVDDELGLAIGAAAEVAEDPLSLHI